MITLELVSVSFFTARSTTLLVLASAPCCLIVQCVHTLFFHLPSYVERFTEISPNTYFMIRLAIFFLH